MSGLGAWGVSRLGNKAGLIDRPNDRSSHRIPIPKGGGFGIFLVFLMSAFYTDLPLFSWLPISLMSLVGFWGDRNQISAKLRLVIQLFLAAIAILGSGQITLSLTYIFPLGIFWLIFIVGTANFYNFMDGINGIAGITGFIGFGLLALYIMFVQGNNLLSTLAVCISLSCAGFLPLNIPKAKVFMGDIGSILLGSIFAWIIYLAAESFLDFFCMASFLFPFYADELTTMAVRIRDGERLTQAHRRHLYQLLANERQIPHWKVSIGFGAMQLLIGLSVFFAMKFDAFGVAFLVGSYFIAFVLSSLKLRTQIEGCKSQILRW